MPPSSPGHPAPSRARLQGRETRLTAGPPRTHDAAVSRVLLAVALLASCLLLWLLLRPNRAEVEPRLGLESWDLVADGEHNSNTDLLLWRGSWWLVYAASPYHMGTPRSRLVVRRCDDPEPRPGSRWEAVAELRVAGADVRDPKLAPIGDRLFLYALVNHGFYAIPSGSVLATSEDGVRWSAFEPVGPEGWLLWRPKRVPDAAAEGGPLWYTSAYWKEHGESILLRSHDGRAWERVSTIHRGEANDETEIEFLPEPDGRPSARLLATARLEMTPDALTGNAGASTLLAFADPPYAEWSEARKLRTQATRLDGPVLFSHGGRVFAVARAQPGARRGLTKLGSLFARKRTALWWIDPGREAPGGGAGSDARAGSGGDPRLVWLSDLPSAGDTSYAGAVLRDGLLYTDYYTSRIDRDWPWLLGMLRATDVRMARLDLGALHALAEERTPR
jgi:hypothetical protein